MRWPAQWSDVRWWKAYVIYLVIVLPLIVADYKLAPGGRWAHAGILAGIIVAGLSVKDRIQRRWWP